MKVLLSIKPEYAEKILLGIKKYEFRKSLFKSPYVKKVVIYASKPVKKVIGEFEIENILSIEPSKLWNITMNFSGINKEFYDNYFTGKNIGHAIKIKNPTRYSNYLDLDFFDIKQAPQSFVYIK